MSRHRELKGNHKAALAYVQEHPDCGTSDVATALGLLPRTAREVLSALYVYGYIGRQLATKNGGRTRWHAEPEKRPEPESLAVHLPAVVVPAAPRTVAAPRKKAPAVVPDLGFDDYWSEHPRLTREQAEAAYRRQRRTTA